MSYKKVLQGVEDIDAIDPKVNPLALSQGVHMTEASSGSNGIQVANNADINFGTGDFSLVWKGSLPNSSSSIYNALFYSYTDSNNNIYFKIQNSILAFRVLSLGSSIIYGSFDISLINDSIYLISLSVQRNFSGSYSLLSLFINNSLVESKLSSVEDVLPTDINVPNWYISGKSTTRTASTTQAAYTYNYALNADQVRDLYNNGVAFEDLGGTNVLDGDSKWREMAPTLGSETYILSMTVHNNKLYGGTYPNGKLLEWNGTNAWVEVAPKLGTETRIRSIAVYNNKLYGGTSQNGKLYEWNGTNAWVEVAPNLGAEPDILSLAVHNNKLYGGTYPNGKLYEWNGTNAWVEVAPKLGAETTIYSLAVHNNKLYGGTYPNGKLYGAGLGCTLQLEPENIQPSPGQWLDAANYLNGMVLMLG